MQTNNKQAVYSISATCRLLKLSRGQFYLLQKAGIFPPSLKDNRTDRSYFNEELKNVCLEIKRSGIGFNNQYHLFYEPRKDVGKPRRKRNNDNHKYSDVIEMLKQMGIPNVTAKEINSALPNIYPDGVPEDQGILLRDLFKYFKNGSSIE
jgi:hypothetical protein